MEMRDRTKEARLKREQEALELTKKRFHNPHPVAWIFIVISVGFLLALSSWQLQRLAWKKGLIAEIASHQLAEAKPLPEDAKLLKTMGFHRVLLEGEFLHDDEIHLAARYYNSQLGYHILTPFQLIDGRIALLNRGWVKADLKDDKARHDVVGKQTLIAMVRTDNDRNYFTPNNDAIKNIWFWRDLQGVEKSTGYSLVPVNLDVLYGEKIKDKPIASNGLVELRNDHLGYAITWFLIAFSGMVIFFYRHYYAPITKS